LASRNEADIVIRLLRESHLGNDSTMARVMCEGRIK
jgi:hypothetical protein